jgi:Histidine kinase-like ATPase domain
VALVDDLVLAVYEALANVVEHAYPPEHPQPMMRLQARVEDRHVLITISDHGRWRTPPREPGYRGRGLAMMRSLITELHLHRGPQGTTVQLRAPPALLRSLSTFHSLPELSAWQITSRALAAVEGSVQILAAWSGCCIGRRCLSSRPGWAISRRRGRAER